ncbi:hypothetical protein WJX81_000873 [Elliptochloris bilobata]|uniref:Insulin-degrading enzyme n=1 Tax=Elliptochloris bilobata TaxID=381761 RepID=A0AAW1QHV7_9CHLO
MAAIPAAPPVAVVQSPQDKRHYKRLTLENGLDVLLIHDPEMAGALEGRSDDGVEEDGYESDDEGDGEEDDEMEEDEDVGEEDEDEPRGAAAKPGKAVKKAAAALAVGVGSFSDPDDVQGLSHYLEHMLFMGSEGFPDENEYDSYLTSHGGSANAFTEMEFTNYHFDVKPEALRGALERFSQFFIAPLCKADALEREVNAVDNEFTGAHVLGTCVQQEDHSRLAQLRAHTARQGHIYRKFSWGNRKSLVDMPKAKGVDVRKELLRYYKGEYSAERMALAVLGAQPLPELEAWARELFAAVPSGAGPRPAFPLAGPPYEGGRLHLLPAVREGHELAATFVFPSLEKEYRAKAEDYISHFVGHEGAGSLLSTLKARGWATAVCAGVHDSGLERNSAAFVFEVAITLTEAGLAAAPGAGLAAIGLLFEYVALLRAAGPQRWAYDEMAAIAAMKFRFAEEEDACDYVARLAADMPHYAPEHALNGSFLHDDWRPELVAQMLDSLTPAAVRLDLQTSAFERLRAEWAAQPGAQASTEPWFNIPYVAAPVPGELLDTWAAAGGSSTSGLALPQHNEFIATDFSLRCGELAEGTSADANGAGHTNGGAANGGVKAAAGVQPLAAPPALLADRPGLRLWHKLDTTFRLPRASVHFLLASPATYDSAHAAAATHAAVALLEDVLCETAYLAEVAGLSYEVWPEGRTGVEVRVEGFSHKLGLLTRTIFERLASLPAQVEPERFGRVREVLVRKYRNANMAPAKHAAYLRLRCLKATWPVEAVLAALEALTLDALRAHLERLLARVHVEALVQGNLCADEARALAHAVRGALPGAPLLSSERPVEEVAALPDGSALLLRAPAKNPEEDNSVAEVYLQLGPDALETRKVFRALAQVAGEPAYDTLRTKEQLGYSVHASVRLTHGMLGFAVVVVSGVHGPAHLDARVDAFLGGYEAALAALEPDALERHRAALIAAKLQKDRGLADEASRHWEQIASRRYNFAAREEEVALLRTLALPQLLAAMKYNFIILNLVYAARSTIWDAGIQAGV